MRISREYIMEYRTDKGSWTQPQLEALGVEWPPVKGWIERISGNELSPGDQKTFQSKVTIKQFRKLGERQ